MNIGLINQLPFDVFWKVSGIIILPNFLNIFNLIFKFTDQIDRYKTNLQNAPGTDADTGARFALTPFQKKLNSYNFRSNLIRLVYCFFSSSLLTIIYAIFKDVPYLFNTNWYEFIVVVLSYLGLLPVIISFYITLKLCIYYINLSTYKD